MVSQLLCSGFLENAVEDTYTYFHEVILHFVPYLVQFVYYSMYEQEKETIRRFFTNVVKVLYTHFPRPIFHFIVDLVQFILCR